MAIISPEPLKSKLDPNCPETLSPVISPRSAQVVFLYSNVLTRPKPPEKKGSPIANLSPRELRATQNPKFPEILSPVILPNSVQVLFLYSNVFT